MFKVRERKYKTGHWEIGSQEQEVEPNGKEMLTAA